MRAQRWSRPMLLLRLVALVAVALAILLQGPRSVRAGEGGKVAELSKTLIEDASYKVRVQAALLLGKLGDTAAVPALTKALGDENKTVRAMAAQALGQLQDPLSQDALRILLKHESDGFVRSQAEKALAALAGGASGKGAKAKIYLAFGSFSGGVKAAGPEHTKMVHDALAHALGKLPSVMTELPPNVDDKSFARSGLVGYLIDGNITRLEDGASGGTPETNCDVKVMVARWPSKSILLWTSAGAGVQAGSRPQDKVNARRDCLEASANQLAEDLAKFLKSQGG